MAKITINPGNLRRNQPGGEHITRIMYDNNEPPKNYIWGKPDGYLYQWNGKKWIKLNEVPNMHPEDIPLPPESNTNYISKSDLDVRLKNLKVEIIAYITKLINDKDCGGSDGSAIKWINENVVPDIRRLQEIDHDVFATKEELEEAVSDIASSGAITELDGRVDNLDERVDNLNENLSGLNGRVTDLEETRVTKDELNAALSDITDSATIINITNRIDELEGNSASKQDLSNAEQVTSAAINDLNLRINDLSNYDHSQFVTAEDINDISSIVL